MSKRARQESSSSSATHDSYDYSMQENEGGMASGKEGSSGPNHPLPMAFPQGNRKIDTFTVKSAGTTFVGPNTDGTNENIWYKLPWENIAAHVNDNTAVELSSKYLFWKYKHINVTVKNPLCIQDIGTGDASLTTAGQNLHANLYGLMDDIYYTSPTNITKPPSDPAKTWGEAEYREMVNSWKKNGFNGGKPIRLPESEFDSRCWTTNSPDVEQCGMGNGEQISFSWGSYQPYWRSTTEFSLINSNSNDTGTDFKYTTTRS